VNLSEMIQEDVISPPGSHDQMGAIEELVDLLIDATSCA